MRVLVTGATGMLGSLLVARWRGRYDVFATGRARPASVVGPFLPFDLSASDHAPLIQWAMPDVIVHCAAWTSLDQCEQSPDLALDVNGRSVERLLHAAPGVRMLFVSSDAVLGDRSHPLDEDAAPLPLNAYARSKLLGERLLLERDGGVCVRTTVVGWNSDPQRMGFVDWLVRGLSRGEPVTLFDDVQFNPIAAAHLANELEGLLSAPRNGVWHISGHDATSKHEFGMRLAAGLGLDVTRIRRGSFADAKLTARRSADQRLSVARYEHAVGRSMPTLDQTVATLVRDAPKF